MSLELNKNSTYVVFKLNNKETTKNKYFFIKTFYIWSWFG